MRIPLPSLLRRLRQRQVEAKITPARQRLALSMWSRLAARPRVYRFVTNLSMRSMAWLGRRRGALRYLPAGRGWTRGRDMPAPEGATFMTRWRRRGEQDT